jgi:phosphatidylserine/phosphatidylglycerophosphate/cardiolipin synthase-like enzyme
MRALTQLFGKVALAPFVLAPALSLLCACNPPPTAAQLNSTRGDQIEVFFNEPGTRLQNMWSPDAVDFMVEIIDGAGASIDFAVMGFSHPDVVDAMMRAHDRGIELRMVGDAGHLYNYGYKAMLERHIPMVTGNLNHIMHDKFMVVDRRFVFSGTANWTPTDLERNSNNFLFLDHPGIAAQFTAEHNQMFNGAYGNNKVQLDEQRTWQVGDTEVEVWFSPNEDAMGRILEIVDGAQESIRFTIFAFTKDQVGSAFIRKQAEFAEWDAADGVSPDAPLSERRSVSGVVDQSQLHSNGQYHEVFRLLGAGVPMRLDANDNSRQPGDYQAGGGRLHSKTMLIDVEGEEPVVITGSFNWSASATQSNDEFLMVLRGGRIANEFKTYFDALWADGREMGESRIADGSVAPGDVVINEIMWYGAHSGDDEGFDEFIELRNLTNEPIELDMWQVAKTDDFVVGFPPGSTVPALGTFLVVDHVLEAYEDGAPQDQASAYLTGDLVLNAFNDNRQARLYLADGSMELRLLDPDGAEMDRAGDGGPPFAGGPASDGRVIRSMERRLSMGDGDLPGSWYQFTGDSGRGVVNPAYADEVLASPGGQNSPE